MNHYFRNIPPLPPPLFHWNISLKIVFMQLYLKFQIKIPQNFAWLLQYEDKGFIVAARLVPLFGGGVLNSE